MTTGVRTWINHCLLILATIVLRGESVFMQTPPMAERALPREILQELIAIQTTEAEGTRRAADMLASRLVAEGFPRDDVRVVGPDEKTACLVARFRSREPSARPVLLMAHLDVVPALREDWSVDPWTLTERDGWFYGRGTRDNKAGAATLVANLIRLKREGWLPARDVIVLLTADEETSQRSIQWLLAQQRPLVDAEQAFNTDGGSVTTRDGRPMFFDVQASEKSTPTISSR